MTRQELIDKGRIWVVHLPNNSNILCEGIKSKCLDYIKLNYGMRSYKKGEIRLGKVIYEPENQTIQL